MTTLREAAQQALEALAVAWQQNPHWQITEGMHALRAALAQQAEPGQDQRCRAEPRSDGDFVCDCKIGECPSRSAALAQQAEPVEPVAVFDARWGQPVLLSGAPLLEDEQPLYTTPPQRKPLTEEEIRRLWYDNGAGIELSRFSSMARAVDRKVRGEDK